MPKNKAYPIGPASDGEASRGRKDERQPTEPLSGSKKVKNRNHSRENHGEGH